MKAKITTAGIEVIPETAAEERSLAETYRRGHLHFLCKAFYKPEEAERKQLLLTPSFVDWKRD